MVKTLQELTRPNIWRLKPYSSARDEYNGAAASVFLDANENPYNMPHNRYPDPMQRELKTELSRIKKVSPDSIFLGNGSDEAIDLVFRAFCEPRVDNVVAIDPTYGNCIFAVSKQEEDQPAYRWRGVSVTGRDWRDYALVTARALGR